MSTNEAPLDFESLTLKLREQYQAVNKMVGEIFSREGSLATTEEVEKINHDLSLAKETESLLRPIRINLESSGQSLPDILKPVVDETIAIVLGLIPRIAELEQAAVSSRDKLAPLIRQSVRAIDMRNAYQNR